MLSPVGTPTLLSQTTWGGAGNESANGIAVAADGSSYVVGTSDSFLTDQFGFRPGIFLVKFAPDGSLVWQKVWNGTTIFGSFLGPAVALGADGSVYVTGTTSTSPSTNGEDAVLLKFNASSGALIWQRTWGGSAFDRSNAVAAASDGSVYITGAADSFGASGTSMFVVKFNAAGTLLWQRIWDAAEGMAVAVAPDGSVYAAGSATRPPGIGNFDVLVLKMTADGGLVWARTYSAGDVVDPRGGMTVAPDGSVYIAGALQAPKMGFVPIAALIIKLTPAGGLVFDTQFGASNSVNAAGVAVAPNGTIYIAGPGNFSGLGDAFVLHLLPTGKSADAVTWGGTGLDAGAGVGVAADGTVMLATTASSPPYSFLSTAKKTAMVKSTLAVPAGTLADPGAAASVADPGAVVIDSNGVTTFGGSTDAALVRIRPAP